MNPVRVFVVDDHAMVRHGLRAFLQTQDDMRVVGEAENGRVAVDELRRLSGPETLPDVVLMDLQMPVLDGVGAIAQLRAEHPDLKLVALTSFSDTSKVHAALEAGASGYLLKNSDPDQISAAIRAAARDQVYLDPQVTMALAQSLRNPTTPVLSAREREVIQLVARGYTNQEIADDLFISERTARTHVSHIISKLGLSSRIQAALWAIREGIASAS
ncbi:MAG: Two component signal transduction regulator, LuxR family [Subtercola sp.]|nr:Two component signal transduction regulator, LuxR family [Subtercola sp.]